MKWKENANKPLKKVSPLPMFDVMFLIIDHWQIIYNLNTDDFFLLSNSKSFKQRMLHRMYWVVHIKIKTYYLFFTNFAISTLQSYNQVCGC